MMELFVTLVYGSKPYIKVLSQGVPVVPFEERNIFTTLKTFVFPSVEFFV